MDYNNRDSNNQYGRQSNWHRPTSTPRDPHSQAESDLGSGPPRLRGGDPRDMTQDGPLNLRIPRQDVKPPMNYPVPGASASENSTTPPTFGSAVMPGALFPGRMAAGCSGGTLPARFPGSMFSSSAATASAILGS
ncbi:hypothetical protein BaRGS_00027712, partial [Batillaria attramentaria]